MTAPKITGARLVLPRYGAGVYRFGNGRGVSVAQFHDPNMGFAIDPDRWDAVAVTFRSDDDIDFAVDVTAGRMDLHEGVTLDELAELALDVRRQAAP